MSDAKKLNPVFDDAVNVKIQKKFDSVFNESDSGKTRKFSQNDSSFSLSDDDEVDIDFDTFLEKESGSSAKNENQKPKTESLTQIDLDLSDDEKTTVLPGNATASTPVMFSSKENTVNDELSINFDFDSVQDVETPNSDSNQLSSHKEPDHNVGYSLDDIDPSEFADNEMTQKTVVVNQEMLKKSNLESFSLNLEDPSQPSMDSMSNDEVKANIESTIKDILKPSFDDGEEDAEIEKSGVAGIEDSILDLGNTPSKGFDLKNALGDEAFSQKLGSEGQEATVKTAISSELTTEFSISELEDKTSLLSSSETSEFNLDDEKTVVQARVPLHQEHPPTLPTNREMPKVTEMSTGLNPSMGSEDSLRYQATIRALREEREDFIAQIKQLKIDHREMEQDNLTLKANLDEAKIEITILRKRHMVELEDLKYRLSVSEEKKAMADEKARQADLRREKLEQKVRIDFNQIKQREKELESKLELLSMDVDSQVQSRDQKILELRRKIDALEFNMENVSIKEQKSIDDKRKLEDKLNKIMKTLRHSIKNLEEDIDEAIEEDQQKDKY